MSRLVTGLQPGREAIRVHGERLERVLVEDKGGPQIDAVARFAEGRGAKVTRVSRGELDRAAKGARHQGAIAYAPEFSLVPVEVLAEELTETSIVGVGLLLLVVSTLASVAGVVYALRIDPGPVLES